MQLCATETTREPKKTFFLEWDELGPSGLRGTALRLDIRATNPENLMPRLFRSPKNVISKFLDDPFWTDDPKVLFPVEVSWMIASDVSWSLPNSQKLVQPPY